MLIAEIGQIEIDQYGNKFQWLICPDCNKPRWVKTEGGEPVSKRCRPCANIITGCWRKGNRHPRFGKGNRIYRGYRYVFVTPQSSFFPMVNKTNKGPSGHITSGYILEHRLVMAQQLKRLLEDSELVHHINGNKLDNRLANLHLGNYANHKTNYGTAFKEGYELGYKIGYEDATKHRMALECQL